jgi:Fe-S-cluster-containing dehydrogenase component
MREGFIFDLNKCVGCQACVIACQIENQNEQSDRWRTVSTFNPFRHPALPLFHFSLACNHCADPLCLESCPTRAFTKDEIHQTIDHRQDYCIGCRYCTWACPYDAPKFIHAKGVVEKCTLCKDRIAHGRKPNCASLCPTGALDFDDIGEETLTVVPGFVDKNLKPAIKIIELRKPGSHRPDASHLTPELTTLSRRLVEFELRKISLTQEWSLLLFTLFVSLLVGLVTSSVVISSAIDPTIVASLGVVTLGLSVLHLGRKARAWRAILNIRSSWLSREIAFTSLFLICLALYLTLSPGKGLAVFASLMGILALVSIDMVYVVAESKPWPGSNSASILLTGILVFSIASKMIWLFSAVSLVKFMLYVYELSRDGEVAPIRRVASVVRMGAGFVAPFLFIGLSGDYVAGAASVAIAELINRAEFYADLEFTTPHRQLQHEFLRRLA